MGRLCLMFSVNHGDLARMPKGEAGAFLLRVVSRLEAGPSLTLLARGVSADAGSPERGMESGSDWRAKEKTGSIPSEG